MPEPTDDAAAFVYVVVPGVIDPFDRATRFEDPLNELLERHGLGEVSGGGTQMAPGPDGTMAIESAGIDVDLASPAHLRRALTLLRAELDRLAAPIGTEVHYTDGTRALLDRWTGSVWQQGQPRT